MRWATSTWKVFAMTSAATSSATAAKTSTNRVNMTFSPPVMEAATSSACSSGVTTLRSVVSVPAAAAALVSAPVIAVRAVSTSAPSSSVTSSVAGSRDSSPGAVRSASQPATSAAGATAAPPCIEYAPYGSVSVPLTVSFSRTSVQASSSDSWSPSRTLRTRVIESPGAASRRSATSTGSAISPEASGREPSATSRGSTLVSVGSASTPW